MFLIKGINCTNNSMGKIFSRKREKILPEEKKDKIMESMDESNNKNNN